jgi:hypothetical protein
MPLLVWFDTADPAPWDILEISFFVDGVVGGVGGCGVGIASLRGRATQSEGLHGRDGEIGDE